MNGCPIRRRQNRWKPVKFGRPLEMSVFLSPKLNKIFMLFNLLCTSKSLLSTVCQS